MTTYSLRHVFAAAGYKPGPLPKSTGSAALSMEQAEALIARFVAEDVAVFKFLESFKTRAAADKPALSPEQLRNSFSLYRAAPYPEYKMELSKRAWLSVKTREITGAQKHAHFLESVTLALHNRGVLQMATSPTAPEIIRSLTEVSKKIDRYAARYWKISAQEAQLIKNIMLPSNPIDPELSNIRKLREMYLIPLWLKTGVHPHDKGPHKGPKIKLIV